MDVVEEKILDSVALDEVNLAVMDVVGEVWTEFHYIKLISWCWML